MTLVEILCTRIVTCTIRSEPVRSHNLYLLAKLIAAYPREEFGESFCPSAPDSFRPPITSAGVGRRWNWHAKLQELS